MSSPPASFVPASPGVTQTISAYLYEEYFNDPDITPFIDGYNQQVQQYIDWFNTIDLPVYTGPLIAGPLLDFVATNLYGVPRPYITTNNERGVGPYNTWAFNTIPFNFNGEIGTETSAAASDDVYKRTITWNFFKGDGASFNVQWLKRRIMRFLFGENGVNYNVDQTWRISVTFGTNYEVTITIIAGVTTVVRTAMFNSFAFNSVAFNEKDITFSPDEPIPFAPYLQAGINQGFLPLPFWLKFEVVI
jgi:hypothetical protein